MRASEVKTKVFVLSHDDAILARIGDSPDLVKINLERLDLQDKDHVRALAENRFFLSDDMQSAVGETSSFVGVVSGRWDERFKKWPTIDELPKALEKREFSSRDFYAPLTMMASPKQFESWIRAQDLVHPGMSALLLEALEITGTGKQVKGRLMPVVMGNNFVIPESLVEEFLAFWRRGYAHFESTYGSSLPFSYRCPKCGQESDEGIGRWGRERHAGFFYERLTALYFATAKDLVALSLENGKARRFRRTPRVFLLRVGALVFKPLASFARLGRPCDHSHKPFVAA